MRKLHRQNMKGNFKQYKKRGEDPAEFGFNFESGVDTKVLAKIQTNTSSKVP
jgi:hypothetical protein